jgi:5-methylcytosine-specific restriction enzyme A
MTPTLSQLKKGLSRFQRGDRPWREGWSEWHVVFDNGSVVPMKYLYGLATDIQPSSLSTDRIKALLRPLGLKIVNIREASYKSDDFDQAVEASRADPVGRAARLKAAPKIPTVRAITIYDFRRNPDVVAEVLERAKGHCEKCLDPAPFIRRKDSSPYLEVHHIVQLAHGGEDTVANTLALCPNCHRQSHHG